MLASRRSAQFDYFSRFDFRALAQDSRMLGMTLRKYGVSNPGEFLDRIIIFLSDCIVVEGVTGEIKSQEYSPHTLGLSLVPFSSGRLHGFQSVLGALGVSVDLTLDERVFEFVGAHGLSSGQLRLEF